MGFRVLRQSRFGPSDPGAVDAILDLESMRTFAGPQGPDRPQPGGNAATPGDTTLYVRNWESPLYLFDLNDDRDELKNLANDPALYRDSNRTRRANMSEYGRNRGRMRTRG